MEFPKIKNLALVAAPITLIFLGIWWFRCPSASIHLQNSYLETNMPDRELPYQYDLVLPFETDMVNDPNYAIARDGPYVKSLFGPRFIRDRNQCSLLHYDFHQGIDFEGIFDFDGTTFNEDNPNPNLCMCDGLVEEFTYNNRSESCGGQTNFIKIKCNQSFNKTGVDWGNIYLRYVHFSSFSKNFVVGENVAKGDTLGYTGCTGASTHHLHLSAQRKIDNNTYINVHPYRLYNPIQVPHLVNKIDDVIVTKFTSSNNYNILRFNIPYNRLSLKEIQLTRSWFWWHYDYYTIDLEDISTKQDRECHNLIPNIELFPYRFNGQNTADNLYNDIRSDLTNDYPLIDVTSSRYGYILDVKVKLSPFYYGSWNCFNIKISDIWGNTMTGRL